MTTNTPSSLSDEERRVNEAMGGLTACLALTLFDDDEADMIRTLMSEVRRLKAATMTDTRVAEAVAKERERCAALARDYAAKAAQRGWPVAPESASKAASHIATAIRNEGKSA